MSGRVKPHKVPAEGARVSGKKVVPKRKRSVYGAPLGEQPTIVWGFSFVDLGGQWSWANVGTDAKRVLKYVRSIESMKPGEVFGSKNKMIPIGNLCADARSRLASIKLDDLDGLWELRVSGPSRIWGHRTEHVYYPIWWDPLHTVCPSKKK